LPRTLLAPIIAAMEAPSSILPPKYDPNDPKTIENPYQVYAKLRRSGPICRGGPGQWVVTRHAEVAALLRDVRLGHQFIDQYQTISAEEPVGTFFQNIIFERDPPRHTRLRQLLGRAFDATLVARLTVRIRRVVDELLAPALDLHRFDAVPDLAYPLPIRVVGELLGIPLTDLDQVHSRARRLSNAFDMRNPPNQDREGANESVAWLRAYLGHLLEQRRKKSCDDVLSTMLATQELISDEIVDNAIFLFFSGLETTKDLIAIGCAALLQYPGELARLRADRSLVSTAIEEFLRYDAPIQALARLVREPIEIGARTVRSGRVLVLLLGSANHDEEQFVEPERLDIGRRPNPHLTFGGGSHYCLGATLTRVAATIAFERLLDFSTFEAAGEPVRRPSSIFRSYESIPIRVKPS
jgi:cytochrome P450